MPEQTERGDRHPANSTEHAPAALQRASFHVDGLDCAEEIALLKRELGDRPGIGRLDFDVLNARMNVEYKAELTSTDAIVRRVAATGMKARLWKEASTIEPGLRWERHLRLLLTVASGLLLMAGLVAHALSSGNLWIALGYSETAITQPVPWLSRLLYIASILFGLRYVAPKAWGALRRVHPDMNLLMTVAVLGAIILNEWFEAAVVTFLFALALLLEHWSIGRARRAISALMSLAPPVARCQSPDGKHQHEKPVADVVVGTTIVVRPGERIPLDGVVRKGTTAIDEAPITGESVPVSKAPGDDVFAGTINASGVIEIETTRESDETMLARILHLVSAAQSRRAESEQWVERFAHYYTPAMMSLGLVVALLPPLLWQESWSEWAYNGLVVLVIACPCALVISTPVSVVSALTCAAHNGVLIKGGRFLEAAGRLQAVALDKTGTLTRGEPLVQEVIGFAGFAPDEMLRLAAGLESHSAHPLARAILRRAAETGIKPAQTEDHHDLSGRGAEARIEGRLWWIGSHRLMTERGLAAPDVEAAAVRMQAAGQSVVALGNEKDVHGLISIADGLRPESLQAIGNLKKTGVRNIVMLTGDNRKTACKVASAAGIDDARAELLPEDKVREVEQLRDRFTTVAMVGDGVNDAPALAAATVGIAMGAIGTDVAIETADVALMSDDLLKLPWLIAHARRSLMVIKQNIFFALGLKLLFVVLTLAGLASLWLAIAADTGASLLVIFNGLRLLRG